MSITQITWIWRCAPTRDARWKAHAHRRGERRGRRRKETLIHAVALRSDSRVGGGSVCFTPELANFCDGTFISGIQDDTVMRFCLFVGAFSVCFLCLDT